MSNKLRSVNTKFWDDPFIESITPNEKLIFLYLLTNPLTNMLGIYEISMRKIAYQTGLSSDEVFDIISTLGDKERVFYVETYIILPKFLKNQNLNTNMKKGAEATYKALPNTIKEYIDTAPLKSFESLRNALESLNRNIEVEIEYEKEFKDFYIRILDYFDEKYRPKTPIQQAKWMECLDQLMKIDKLTYSQIEKMIVWARGDDFWATNFRSLLKLRQSNKEGIMWHLIFQDKYNKTKPVNKPQKRLGDEKIRL